MLKRALMALIITILGLNAATAAEYFIQLTATPPDKTYVDEADAPGGIEIYKDDVFVACVLGFTIETWNGDKLAPVSFGFISKYPLAELKIKPRGALSRANISTKETKIE
jgi:hypothetical protein